MSGEPLNPTDFASAVTAITSAFGDPTRRAIYLFAHEVDGGVTASAVAERFELHPNVARHHLDKLSAGGYLEVQVVRAEGRSAGRPSKHYRAVTPTISLDIAVRHDDILVSLLGKALSRLDPADAAELAEEVGTEYGRRMAAAMGDTGEGQRSFRAALHAVADALSAHGFAAHAEQDGDQLRIVSAHCPFGDSAIEHPVICAVDRGMVKGMLEALYGRTDPEIETSVALGADQCVTAVEA
ncbi:helix-turn-helix transcriptional regulator [Actinomarinicola tropica]|uniref:Helix-turn-helix domain-containing protein n=1 Tax=Actinomarinicola tropica TaxID=2789776 RepID=A0A5Q2RI28_9ACTN|nr:helix-turn-helix domain-containing protein [Actinomarinicola tropica]QGG94542.1 helix-turn-helix domain-containing protein [Actinomarinicola tropica]